LPQNSQHVNADCEHQQVNRSSARLLSTLNTAAALVAVGLAPHLLRPPGLSIPAGQTTVRFGSFDDEFIVA